MRDGRFMGRKCDGWRLFVTRVAVAAFFCGLTKDLRCGNVPYNYYLVYLQCFKYK